MKASFSLQLFIGHSVLAPSAASQPTNHPRSLPLPPSLSRETLAIREAGGREVLLATHSSPRTHTLTHAGRQAGSRAASQPAKRYTASPAPSVDRRNVADADDATPGAEAPDAAAAEADEPTDGRVVNFLLPSSSPTAAAAAAAEFHNETS